jgi:hypothetical protein
MKKAASLFRGRPGCSGISAGSYRGPVARKPAPRAKAQLRQRLRCMVMATSVVMPRIMHRFVERANGKSRMRGLRAARNARGAR